jgi:hypothetical protein
MRLRRKLLAVVPIAIVLPAVVLAAGCAQSATSTPSTATLPTASSSTVAPTTPTSSPAPGRGTLQGRFQATGGVVAGPMFPLSGTVMVTGQGLTQQVTVGKDGTFRIDLPPGRYTLVGSSPRVTTGTDRCPTVGPAEVVAGTIVSVDVFCSVH